MAVKGVIYNQEKHIWDLKISSGIGGQLYEKRKGVIQWDQEPIPVKGSPVFSLVTHASLVATLSPLTPHTP